MDEDTLNKTQREREREREGLEDSRVFIELERKNGVRWRQAENNIGFMSLWPKWTCMKIEERVLIWRFLHGI